MRALSVKMPKLEREELGYSYALGVVGDYLKNSFRRMSRPSSAVANE